MKFFARVIFISIIFVLPLCAEFIEEFSLKKDEEKRIEFLIEGVRKNLVFRWTLFKDDGLVIHSKFDNEPRQFVLLARSLNAYKIHLSKTSRAQDPYVIFYFVDFDKQTEQAKFRYYLFSFTSSAQILE